MALPQVSKLAVNLGWKQKSRKNLIYDFLKKQNYKADIEKIEKN